MLILQNIFQVIAEHLSIEEVEVIRDMFKLMDTDNSGKITYEELKAGLQKVGSQLAEPEMKMLMEVVWSSAYSITHASTIQNMCKPLVVTLKLVFLLLLMRIC